MGASTNAAREPRSLRALIVEDSLADAELILAELEFDGYQVHQRRVETADALRDALAKETWDIVLSDYSLPTLDAPAALEIVRKTNPDLPFIIVSGTIGEDVAVESLKAGAADFLVKGKLHRLCPAIERELREVAERAIRAGERLALEERLRQSQKLEGIGRLAGGIAHDFNNLLTAIAGYTEMVLEQIGHDKPISRDLHEIREASDRAIALTRQLLAFSRKQTLNVVAVDVNGTISAMKNMLERLIRENIVITLELAEGSPTIRADRLQLEQIVMNLVVNARDAMPAGGTVNLATAIVDADQVASAALTPMAPGAYVRLTVSDNGQGMDDATRARIFEPFFTTKGKHDGTGLGLATVYGVVQQMGGQITVTSAIGMGARFDLFFPSSLEAEGAPLPTRRRPPAPLATRRETVLVVEDQRGVRQLITRILTRHGYSVIEAPDAIQALELAKSGASFDLVVSDVIMPMMSGPEFIARLREMRGEFKMLYISGHTGDDLTTENSEQTPRLMLQKPFTASVLLQAVRDVLDDQID